MAGTCWQCPEYPVNLLPPRVGSSHPSALRYSQELHSSDSGQWQGYYFLPGSRISFTCFLWNMRYSKVFFKSFSIHMWHLNSLGYGWREGLQHKYIFPKCSKNFEKLWKCQAPPEIPTNVIQINCTLLKLELNVWLGTSSKSHSTITVSKMPKYFNVMKFES